MKPYIQTKFYNDHICLPFTAPAVELGFPHGVFTSDIIIPISISKKCIILDAANTIKLPTLTPVKDLFETIQITENGYSLHAQDDFHADIYTDKKSITCEIWNKDRTEITESATINFNELIELHCCLDIKEGSILKDVESYVQITEMELFNCDDQFHGLMTIANVDLDLECDGSQSELFDSHANKNIYGFDKIRRYINESDFTLTHVIKASLADDDNCNLYFNPEINFTLSAPSQGYEGTSFLRLDINTLIIDPNELLKEVYGFLAGEIFA